MLTEHAAWDRLLGLPLEKALEIARTWEEEPQVLVTCAPKRPGAAEEEQREGTLRVIRVRAGELTVSLFPDGMPKEK